MRRNKLRAIGLVLPPLLFLLLLFIISMTIKTTKEKNKKIK
jgi:ABC-type Na+ efflux pump permease subunit